MRSTRSSARFPAWKPTGPRPARPESRAAGSAPLRGGRGRRGRSEEGYGEVQAEDTDEGMRGAAAAAQACQPLSIGLLGNAADLVPALLKMGAPINVVTDQTSAHDPLTYLPRGVAFEDMAALRAEDPAGFTRRARESMAAHVEAMVGFMDAGAEVFDYGDSIRAEA